MAPEEDDNGEEYGSNPIAGILLIVFLIAVVYKCRQDQLDKTALWAEYQKTTGWIVSYSEERISDLGTGRDITYGYRVGEKEYFRNVYTRLNLPECDDHRETSDDCARKRFWVIYLAKDPDKSLINLTTEVQDLSDQDVRLETFKEKFY